MQMHFQLKQNGKSLLFPISLIYFYVNQFLTEKINNLAN